MGLIARLERTTDIMRNFYARIVLCVVCCNVLLAVAFAAQKHAPKGDDWPLQNASIGEIEIAAGTSHQVQVMYPAPDGPSFPLKASVAWSIEPAVKGISIDQAGKLTVDGKRPAWHNRNHPCRYREGKKKVVRENVCVPSGRESR